MSIFLQTERLTLNPVTQNHCTETYLGWLNDYEVNRFLETGNYPSTINTLYDFISNQEKQKSLFLAIHLKSSDKHIGNIKIDGMHPIHRTAEYGILLGDKKEWGKGYAKEATQAVLTHCFNRLNIRKITLGVVKDNVAAVELYKKLGFEIEGCYINHCYYDGAYRDIYRMGLIKKF